MIHHLRGQLTEKTPTLAVLECQGVGYLLHISLNTYAALPEKGECLLYTHQVVREDAHLLYGFYNRQEREVFRQLISVSGVGASTARVILSSLSAAEVRDAIASEDVGLLKSIKGIGAKSAQRIIVDLRDKLDGMGGTDLAVGGTSAAGPREEALQALEVLGFARSAGDKAVNKVLKNNPGADLETLLKEALKNL